MDFDQQTANNILIISPFEANALHDHIKVSSKARLHVYAPRVNKVSSNLSGLDFLVVSGEEGRTRSRPSAQAVRDINLLTGSTYLNSYAEYEALHLYLGVVKDMQAHYHNLGQPLGGDGFVDPAARRVAEWAADCPFEQSLIPFFQAWYSVRMKGQDFSDTHFGHVARSKPLTKEDFGEKAEPDIKRERTDQEESLFVRDDSLIEDDEKAESTGFGNGEADAMDMD